LSFTALTFSFDLIDNFAIILFCKGDLDSKLPEIVHTRTWPIWKANLSNSTSNI